jgi:hypothetical protein
VMFQFLWNGHSETQHYHLCRWEVLSRPKKIGGWGLQNLFLFNTALNTNTLWRVLSQDSIWHRVVFGKYIQNQSLVNWLRKPSHLISSASRIWSSLLHTLPIIQHWLCWRPGAGFQIEIGRDKILGLGESSFLRNETIKHLNHNRVFVLAQVSVAKNSTTKADGLEEQRRSWADREPRGRVE